MSEAGSGSPFVEMLLGFVRVDPESGEYSFVERADEAIDKIVEAISLFPDSNTHFDALISLSLVFESELRSPNAAAYLRAVLLANPTFMAAIGCVEGWEGFSANPELALWSGGQDVKQAPMFGAETPKGTMKAGVLRDVVPPHIRKRARAAAG